MQKGGRKVHVVDEQMDPGVAGDLDRQAAIGTNESRRVLRNKLVGRLAASELNNQAVVTRVRTDPNVSDCRPG
jgi:hypothetical protein